MTPNNADLQSWQELAKLHRLRTGYQTSTVTGRVLEDGRVKIKLVGESRDGEGRLLNTDSFILVFKIRTTETGYKFAMLDDEVYGRLRNTYIESELLVEALRLAMVHPPA
jgi:hypothetical protein